MRKVYLFRVLRTATVVGALCIGLALLAAACGGSSEEKQPGAAGTEASLQEVSPEDAEAVRALCAAYWEAWNTSDVDKVLSLLAEPFRSERGEEIKANVEKLGRWKMSISFTEANPPHLRPDGEIVMYVNVKKPLSTDLTQMRFRKVGESWVIVYASKD